MSCEIEPASVWPAKDPADKLDYGVDFEGSLARRWERGRTYTLTTRIRPTRANGFEAECTTAGQTGTREPIWKATAGATVVDGSAVWTMRVLSTASLLTTISGAPMWTSDAGITISDETVSGQMAIAYIDGGTDGGDYSVLVTATCADTTIRSKVCILPVRRAVRVCDG